MQREVVFADRICDFKGGTILPAASTSKESQNQRTWEMQGMMNRTSCPIPSIHRWGGSMEGNLSKANQSIKGKIEAISNSFNSQPQTRDNF